MLPQPPQNLDALLNNPPPVKYDDSAGFERALADFNIKSDSSIMRNLSTLHADLTDIQRETFDALHDLYREDDPTSNDPASRRRAVHNPAKRRMMNDRFAGTMTDWRNAMIDFDHRNHMPCLTKSCTYPTDRHCPSTPCPAYGCTYYTNRHCPSVPCLARGCTYSANKKCPNIPV